MGPRPFLLQMQRSATLSVRVTLPLSWQLILQESLLRFLKEATIVLLPNIPTSLTQYRLGLHPSCLHLVAEQS